MESQAFMVYKQILQYIMWRKMCITFKITINLVWTCSLDVASILDSGALQRLSWESHAVMVYKKNLQYIMWRRMWITLQNNNWFSLDMFFRCCNGTNIKSSRYANVLILEDISNFYQDQGIGKLIGVLTILDQFSVFFRCCQYFRQWCTVKTSMGIPCTYGL